MSIVGMLGFGYGCGMIARDVSRAGIDETLEVLAEPESRGNIAEVLGSPEARDVTRQLSSAAAQGVVQGLVEPDSNVAARVSGAATTAAMDAFADGLATKVGPALAAATDAVGPAVVEQIRQPEVAQAIGAIAREISYQAVLGSNAAMGELQREGPPEAKGPFAWLTPPVTFGWAVLVALTAGLALALVVMAILLVKNASHRRQLERDVHQRESMLFALLQSTGDRELSPETRREIVRRFDDSQ